MSDFEEYIKVNHPRDYERQKRIYPDQNVEELYSEDHKMWQHQQAKIEKLENELSTTKQVLGNVIDMEVAKVDNLKAQLNKMETCYIEKKKQVRDQQKRIDEVLQEVKGLERFTGEDCIADFDVLQGAVSHACRGEPRNG